jgi:hypothetical protein
MTALSESFSLPLSSDNAWPLFTARGERAWAPGWDPAFPGDGDDRTESAVFTTTHGQETTMWVVTTVEPGRRIGYARVTPGVSAGTVVVRCRPLGPTETQVTVTYRLTALTAVGAAQLADFAAGFSAGIRGWRDAIIRLPGPHTSH